VIVSFKNRIDEIRLAKSIRLAMDRQPVLGCRFVENGRRAYWERRADLNTVELNRTVISNNLETDLFEFVTQPNDPCSHPLVQARVFRSAAGDTLCLKINHVAADGRGTKEIAYLVADTYTHLEADPNYIPEPGKFGQRSQMEIFRAAGLKNLMKYRPRTLSLPAMHFNLPFAGVEPTGQSFAIRQVAPQEFRALKQYAREHNATVNDLVLTALYRGMFTHGNPPENVPLPVQVSIDLRHFLPQGKEQPICNLSGALFPAIEFKPGETFEQTLADVIIKMGRWKASQPGLTGAMLIELAMAQGFAAAKAAIGRMTAVRSNRVTPLLLSNFGILDVKKLIFGSLEIQQAFVLGPIMFGHGLMLTASTYADQMTLAMGYCQGNIEKNLVEALIEQIWQEMLAQIQPVYTIVENASLPIASGVN
jgi:NRPS condensation-like uncharacterized protein